MKANIFKPAMAALVVAIATTGLVACGTSDKSEPVSKATESPATTSAAQPATQTPPDTKANPFDTTKVAPDAMAKAGDVVKEGTSEAAPPDTATANAQPAASSTPMTAQDEAKSMSKSGQANDPSTPATQPIPKN